MGVAANLADCCKYFNLGADVAAMAAFQLLVGRKLFLYAIFFGGVFLLLQVYVPYRIYGAIVSALDFLASLTN
jgi:hypothetical protein